MNAAPALKGTKITTENENSAPLVIVEGKKEGKNTVLSKITLSSEGKTLEPLADGTVFTGVFEAVKVVKSDNYDDRSYVSIRSLDGTLTNIKITGSLEKAMAAARSEGLKEGDAIEVTYLSTIKLKSGAPFFKYAVQI